MRHHKPHIFLNLMSPTIYLPITQTDPPKPNQSHFLSGHPLAMKCTEQKCPEIRQWPHIPSHLALKVFCDLNRMSLVVDVYLSCFSFTFVVVIVLLCVFEENCNFVSGCGILVIVGDATALANPLTWGPASQLVLPTNSSSPKSNCICLNCQMYLSEFPNVFFQLAKCILTSERSFEGTCLCVMYFCLFSVYFLLRLLSVHCSSTLWSPHPAPRQSLSVSSEFSSTSDPYLQTAGAFRPPLPLVEKVVFVDIILRPPPPLRQPAPWLPSGHCLGRWKSCN